MRAHASKDPQSLLALAARTAAPTDVTFNSPCIGGLVVINVTAVTATPSITVTLTGVVGEATYTILVSAAITATGTTVLRVHPSLTAAANTIAKDVLPHTMKLSVAHGDTDSITYSVEFVGVD